MRILCIKAGSATLKFGVFDPGSATPLVESTTALRQAFCGAAAAPRMS